MEKLICSSFFPKFITYASKALHFPSSASSPRSEAVLNRVGYTPDISHGVLVEMVEHWKELDKKTKPILDTLRSYQDLPPDKALASLVIEDKKRQYTAAEKYLEDVLQSELPTTD